MSRKRILHIVQNLNYGGLERLLVDLSLRADPERFDVRVLSLQSPGRFARELGGRVEVQVCPPMRRWSFLRPTELAREIERVAPDIVHTHSGVWYKSSLAARMAGVPRVLHTEHGLTATVSRVDRAILRAAARRTDVVIAVSRPLARYLEEQVASAHSTVALVPNGVDTEAMRPAADDGRLRSRLGVARLRPIIGSVGRLEAIKGFDIVIDAFGILKQHWQTEAPFPALVLAGDGSQRGALEAQARARRVADDVHFLGWQDDVRGLYSTFEIFTLGSRSEGTPLTLLESMSAGVCPIVTSVGGMPHVLGPRLAHRLVASESPDGLAAAWYHALAGEPHRVAADAAAARERAVSAFDVRDMIRAYEELYERDVRAYRESPDRRAVPARVTAAGSLQFRRGRVTPPID